MLSWVVLVSFFESQPEAVEGLAMAMQERRVSAAVLARKPDGTYTELVTPRVPPVGLVVGAALGAMIGLLAGQAGAVLGFFFGLYAGLAFDAWRAFARLDLLEEVQGGLAPGKAALVLFVRGSTAGAIDARLAETRGVTLHRSPNRPIAEDLAREVQDACTELRHPDGGTSVANARRKVVALAAIADRLLWLEGLQFEFEIQILNRQIEGSPEWRASHLRRRARTVRAAHVRTTGVMEASRNRAQAAAAAA